MSGAAVFLVLALPFAYAVGILRERGERGFAAFSLAGLALCCGLSIACAWFLK